jgi:DDE domain
MSLNAWFPARGKVGANEYRYHEDASASRGTDGSNPVPSSAESVANLTFGAHSIGEPKVGIQPARKLLRQRTRRWHLDEMVVPIARKRMYLSRAVDHEGEILDISAHYDSLFAVPATISKVPTKAHLPAV